VKHVNLHRFWRSEQGFTIIELMIPIISMTILISAAVPIWLGAVESRKVDSATNQMVADLRRAHTSATNRLAPWRVVLQLNTRKYQIGRTGGSLTSSSLLDARDPAAPDPNPPVKLTGTVTVVEFQSDGRATITASGSPQVIQVAAQDGNPCNRIAINTVTSQIKVSPNAC